MWSDRDLGTATAGGGAMPAKKREKYQKSLSDASGKSSHELLARFGFLVSQWHEATAGTIKFQALL